MYPVQKMTTGMTTYKWYGYMSIDPPNMIFYGDSHIGRLLSWKLDVCARGGPDIAEQYFLKNSKFVYSGGSKWANIHERVQGKGVPLHQRQGNLWQMVLDDVDKGLYSPEFLYISLLGNDMCQLNDSYYHHLRNSDKWHILVHSQFGPSDYYLDIRRAWFDDRVLPTLEPIAFDHQKFINKNLKNIKGHIDSTMLALKKAYPNLIYFMLAPIIRSHWFPAIRNMIPKLLYYIETTHGVKICQMNQFIQGRHLDENDKVHMTPEGYKLFVSKGLGPLLDHHWAKNKPKVTYPTELHHMTKAQRKRFYSRLCHSNAKSKYWGCMMEGNQLIVIVCLASLHARLLVL